MPRGSNSFVFSSAENYWTWLREQDTKGENNFVLMIWPRVNNSFLFSSTEKWLDLIRPKIYMGVFQVSRPYIDFCLDSKHFIVKILSNTLKMGEISIIPYKIFWWNKMIMPTDHTQIFQSWNTHIFFFGLKRTALTGESNSVLMIGPRESNSFLVFFCTACKRELLNLIREQPLQERVTLSWEEIIHFCFLLQRIVGLD